MPAEAQLILNIDPNTDELFFTGTDSGTPDTFTVNLPGATISLSGIEFGAPATFSEGASAEIFLSTVVSATGSNSTSNARFSADPSAGGATNFQLRFANTSQTTLTGNSVRNSLSGINLPPSFLDHLATLDGVVLPRIAFQGDFSGVQGTGFESISINVLESTAVPEPSSLAVLALTGLTLVGRRRRS